jgi:hypothetical protein
MPLPPGHRQVVLGLLDSYRHLMTPEEHAAVHASSTHLRRLFDLPEFNFAIGVEFGESKTCVPR